MRLGTVPGLRDYLRQKRDEMRRREIADIKADGYIVYTEMVTDPATGKRYARYSM